MFWLTRLGSFNVDCTCGEEAKVSEPTVNRFCRTFGATGFPDFKLKLAQSLASGPTLTTAMVSEADTLPEIFAKLTDKAICSVQDLKDSLDVTNLERALISFVRRGK